MHRIDSQLSQFPFLNALEELTGIRKLYIAIFLAGLLLIVIMSIRLSVICSAIAFVYPMWQTLKTIELIRNTTTVDDHETEEVEDWHGEQTSEYFERKSLSLSHHSSNSIAEFTAEEEMFLPRSHKAMLLRRWCVYWMVYGLFQMFESLTDSVLSWIPAYQIFKVALLIWCFRFNGSATIYMVFLRPLLHRNAELIEESASITSTIVESTKLTTHEAIKYVREKKLSLHSFAQFSAQISNKSHIVNETDQQPKSIFTIQDDSQQNSIAYCTK